LEKDNSIMAEQPRPRIYMPKQESEMLPGIPLWLLAYTVMLGIMGVAWVVIIGARVGNQETHLFYGVEIVGVVITILIFLCGLFIIASAFGVARLKMWGWRLARILCWGWVALSGILWLIGILQVRTEDRIFFILATVLGVSAVLGFSTINQALRGDGVQDMIDPPMIGVPFGRRLLVPAPLGVGILGAAVVYLIFPIFVAFLSLLGMFIVVSLLVHHPIIWTQASRAIVMVLVLILVGGAVNHLFLLELLHFERVRFETPAQG
jgi:hypothetical protein